MHYSSGIPSTVVSGAVQKYAAVPGGLMPLLHEIQAGLGFIPRESVAEIARGMGLSRAEVHGVISYYHDFRYQPAGRRTIQLCRAEACQAVGSRSLEAHVKNRLGIDYGGTTPDGRFSLEPVYCLGNCACGPSLRVGDEVFARVGPERFDSLLDDIQHA